MRACCVPTPWMGGVLMFLDGYRMVDMCWMGGGPFTAQVLGDLGFDVIKVMEVPGNSGRRAGPSTGSLIARNNGVQMSHYRFGMRNARCIQLDLKSKQGLEVFHRLIEKTDVITEGFRPGVADRLGVGYEALKKINPRLVYAAITGYGQTGPYRDKPGHDVNFESIAGFIGMNGRAGGPPVVTGGLVADFAVGAMSAVTHILAALLRRAKTGQGAYCDVSLTDAVFETNTAAIGPYLGAGVEMQRGEMYFSGFWPFNDVYETRDGAYISLGAWEPYFFGNLCEAVQREDLIELQWVVEKRDHVRAELGALFRTRTQAEWVALFEHVDACVTPVNTPAQAANDPQMRARDMVVELEHPIHGKVPMVGSMFKLDGQVLEARHWMNRPGEHTAMVLAELGYSEGEIADLRAQGLIA
ncbi:MAG: CoA transferase [Gammaproteobacteria bacterium]|nr:CoA transferase [Gammaproteobacteria bacterium]MBP6053581.1 CoA transferase [Pseudomonadales bacterium]MBK6583234.1 CoA transferase [Gammaproteobacteria bacterium]MBK7170697.1 CoA transferase [Gammaproteobacteria bacterium]MBK7519367.1 CoA transferase [Gammaproteobacteria bacterium]